MPAAAVIWVWLCAYLNCAGWVLSALHQLNAAGYAVVFALGFGALWWWHRWAGVSLHPRIYLPKFRRRFGRFFPLCFLILASLAFLGGALYAPANFDTLAYRTPRVLHWLAEEQWHWIHTEFARLNTRSAGFEWVTAPLFLFTGSDRLEFLLNLISFLLLPGRVFAVLTRLGVRLRTAWFWMWLFPAGYGYVLQAGSGVNDLFGALVALCAFEFALRGAREKHVGWLWTSAVAAALMTSVKTFNIVLGLPWLIAILPGTMVMLRRPLATLLVALFAIGASMVPTAMVNAYHCQDWTGASLEQTPVGSGAEVLRTVANVGGILIYNFQPPIFPFTKQWEAGVARLIPSDFAAQLKANMEGGLSRFPTAELMTEETAGLGCGVSLLLLLVLLRKLFPPRGLTGFARTGFFTTGNLVALGAWCSLLVIISQVGYVGPARYLLPLYVLLCVPFLTGAVPEWLTRQRFWRWAGLAVFALALPVLILSPQRPLWPAQTVLRAMNAETSTNRWLQRTWTVYSVYGSRAESFDPILKLLPPGQPVLGFVGMDSPEAALWQPFGTRRIRHIRMDDTAANIRARGIKYALVNADVLPHNRGMNYDAWLQRVEAQPFAALPLKIRAGKPAEDWRLISFK